MSDKKSLTGLMTQQHEVHRLENLFYKEVGSAYYLPLFGLEWAFFLSERVELPVNSFLSYLTQEATTHGIIITNIESNVSDFALNLNIKLLSEETIYLTGSTI